MSESVFVLKQTCYITNSNSVEALTSSTIKKWKIVKFIHQIGLIELIRYLILLEMVNGHLELY